jgi:hypothetical protein
LGQLIWSLSWFHRCTQTYQTIHSKYM